MATKRIKTFEEACKAQKLNPKKVLPDVSMLPEEHRAAIIAAAKLFIIQKSLNGKWKANWSDFNQPKYYPWFDVNKEVDSSSGFGLSYDGYVYDSSGASLGVRLYYKDSDTAKYAGQQFIALYEDLILIPK